MYDIAAGALRQPCSTDCHTLVFGWDQWRPFSQHSVASLVKWENPNTILYVSASLHRGMKEGFLEVLLGYLGMGYLQMEEEEQDEDCSGASFTSAPGFKNPKSLECFGGSSIPSPVLYLSPNPESLPNDDPAPRDAQNHSHSAPLPQKTDTWASWGAWKIIQESCVH